MMVQNSRFVLLCSRDSCEAHSLPLLLACLGWDENSQGAIRILEEIAAQLEGKLQIGIVQQGFMKEFMKNHHIEGTPTLLLFFKNQEIDRIQGVFSLQEVLEVVHKTLSETE